MSNETPAEVLAHPIQPLEVDENGTLRFKKNAIVRHLLDHGGIDMNALAVMDFSREDREHFAQLIGYSHGGAGELSYMSDEVWYAAQEEYESRGSERSLAAGKVASCDDEWRTVHVLMSAGRIRGLRRTEWAELQDALVSIRASAPPADPAKAEVGEGLTSKQAWWAGARAGLGVPADMPREQAAELLAAARTAKASGSAPDVPLPFAEEATGTLSAYENGWNSALHDVRPLIEQCRKALAEELAAYDIDPPIEHVKQAHDKCAAFLTATPPASAPEVTEEMVTGMLREYLRREPSEEGIVELEDPVSREFARGLLIAALTAAPQPVVPTTAHTVPQPAEADAGQRSLNKAQDADDAYAKARDAEIAGQRKAMTHLCDRGLFQSWRDCPAHNGQSEGVDWITDDMSSRHIIDQVRIQAQFSRLEDAEISSALEIALRRLASEQQANSSAVPNCSFRK